MQRFSWLFTLPFAVFLIVFTLSNRQTLELSLFPFNGVLSAPAFVWLLALFTVGFFCGGLVVQFSRFKDKRTIRQLKKSHQRLNKDVSKLDESTNSLKKALADARQNSIENPYFLNDNPDVTLLIPKQGHATKDH